MVQLKVLGLLFILSIIPSLSWAEDETTEPALAHALEINGQSRSIELGKPLVLSGTFTNPTVKLTAAAVRHFDKAGIEFDYPASFTWEADLDVEISKSWTLSGNDFKIMVFKLTKGVTAEAYASGMVKQFGAEKTTLQSTERKLGQKSYKGQLIRTTLVNTVITMEIFEIPSESASRIVVFQDSPSEDSKVSEEGENGMKIVSGSFSYE